MASPPVPGRAPLWAAPTRVERLAGEPGREDRPAEGPHHIACKTVSLGRFESHIGNTTQTPTERARTQEGSRSPDRRHCRPDYFGRSSGSALHCNANPSARLRQACEVATVSTSPKHPTLGVTLRGGISSDGARRSASGRNEFGLPRDVKNVADRWRNEQGSGDLRRSLRGSNAAPDPRPPRLLTRLNWRL